MLNGINSNDVTYWRERRSEVSAKRVLDLLTEGFFIDVYTNEETGVSFYRIDTGERILSIRGAALEWLHERVSFVDCTAEFGKPVVVGWRIYPIDGGAAQRVGFAGRLRLA